MDQGSCKIGFCINFKFITRKPVSFHHNHVHTFHSFTMTIIQRNVKVWESSIIVFNYLTLFSEINFYFVCIAFLSINHNKLWVPLWDQYISYFSLLHEICLKNNGKKKWNTLVPNLDNQWPLKFSIPSSWAVLASFRCC